MHTFYEPDPFFYDPDPIFYEPAPVFEPVGLYPLEAALLFDDGFYLATNPDVAAAGFAPLGHYATFGWLEGRDPNAFFDTEGYLFAYPDVAAAGIDPLVHYALWGWLEGRDPSASFDTDAYLPRLPRRGRGRDQSARALPLFRRRGGQACLHGRGLQLTRRDFQNRLLKDGPNSSMDFTYNRHPSDA